VTSPNLIFCSYRIVKLPRLAFNFDLLLVDSPLVYTMENDQVCRCARLFGLVPRANEISTLQGLLVDLYVPRKCTATSMYLKTDRQTGSY
jgi:hypothetical protein